MVVFAQVLAGFRYGREDLDVLGLNFRRDLIDVSFYNNRVSRYGMAWHGILANSTEKGYPKVYFHGVKVFKKSI